MADYYNKYLSLLNVPNIWNAGITGNNIKIAIFEDAINNIENKLKIEGWFNTFTNSYSEKFLDSYVTSEHSFSTASVIAGSNIGVAPNTKLYNVIIKTLLTDVDGILSSIKKGLKWCIVNDIDIINLSLEIPKVDSELLYLAKEAFNKNITIVCAAGNSGKDIVNPFVYSNATLSIGSINADKSLSSFSNYGEGLNFVCFGDAVPSYGSNGDIRSHSGTSCASALTSGLIALLKEQNPYLTNKELQYILMDNTEDLGVIGRDDKFGYGLIKAFILPSKYKSVTEINSIESTINITDMIVDLNTALLPNTTVNPIIQIKPSIISTDDVFITSTDDSIVSINHFTNSITGLKVGKPTITFSVPKRNYSKSLILRILSGFESEIETSLSKYNIPYVQSHGCLGNNIKVAIIDAGVNQVGNIDNVIYGPNYIYYNSTTSKTDDYGQGTITASIVKSIAPNCQIYSIKNQNGGAYSYLGEALQNSSLQWCLDNKMDIVIARNLLLGVYTSKNTMFKKLNDAGIITIVKQLTGDATKFAASKTVDNFCVGLLNSNNTPFVSVNTVKLDVTCYYSGFPAYTKDGKLQVTSTQDMGASLGIVGGICALLKEQNRILNVTSLRSLLPKLCTNIGDYSKFGYGILKAAII